MIVSAQHSLQKVIFLLTSRQIVHGLGTTLYSIYARWPQKYARLLHHVWVCLYRWRNKNEWCPIYCQLGKSHEIDNKIKLGQISYLEKIILRCTAYITRLKHGRVIIIIWKFDWSPPSFFLRLYTYKHTRCILPKAHDFTYICLAPFARVFS